MSKIDDGTAVHCSIPSHPSQIVGCWDYWSELMRCKNKGQIIRVMARVLSSHGRHGNMMPDEARKKIEQYLEDFNEN